MFVGKENFADDYQFLCAGGRGLVESKSEHACYAIGHCFPHMAYPAH